MTARSVQIATRAELMSREDFIEYVDSVLKEIKADAFKEAADRGWPFVEQEFNWRHEAMEDISQDGISEARDFLKDKFYAAILADKQEPRLTLVCDQCGRIEHEPYEEGDHCWTGCGRFRIKDKQESTCPACGRSWDMSRFNSCECGASLADKQEPQ